ncbi:hypothetical protein HGG82_10050 [Marinomonas sp. M1K-6]|uniref:Porin n=1 Tax=Marinomonas profundi TaxID=2726122 RepID=A0A847QYF7_9GAMM|nr:carbohydrate porin [Marinomonas profundi]NLQ17969.1 hypothetical protein [Marinomonas profundi]UDV01695.1 carbohydrate porin [Marinomonas profundi]
MKKSILYTAIVTGLLSAGAIHAAPSFDANFELNTDAIDKAVGDTTYDQNGRVELNAYSKHTSGENFFAGKGSVLLTTDGTAVVDDAFIQLGNNTWDLQLGRFEGINLFPLAKDTLIVHAIDGGVYEANKVRGRVGDNGGQIAFHYKASEMLKFEVDTLYGDGQADKGDGKSYGDKTTAIAGIRPSVTFVTDAATISAGFESVKYDTTDGATPTPTTGKVDLTGYAVTANFDMGAANVNLAAAHSKDDISDKKTTSFVANMVYGNFGLGVIASSVDNKAGSDPSLLTTYVAYTVPVLDIENATVTFAGSYSTADDVAAGDNDKVTAARVRFNYGF